MMRSCDSRSLRFVVVLAAGLLGAGCGTTGGGGASSSTQAAAAVTTPPPAVDATTSAHLQGLHNVVTYADRYVGGAVPEGREGMQSLAAMGIKTIISVDGAVPDVEGAQQFGMHYIHLPISYNGIAGSRQQELAQAIANAPGPVYVHCHHGKHRSASALGSALVLAGILTPDAAKARMQVSGTAKGYQGLWKAVEDAKPLPASALQADWRAFPKVAKVTGLVATMSEIDTVWDNLLHTQKAGWQTPADHPDLVPTKEARRLASLYAQLLQDPDSKQRPAAYQTLLQEAIAQSAALDAAVASGDHASAEAQFALLQKGCKACHKDHRDQ
jgi:protein tyrosine phosphatase (PTP) superfamily phosphohydrolase (DUF442 family)